MNEQPDQPEQPASPKPAESPMPGSPDAPSKDAKTLALLAHMLGIVSGFVGPLIIWLIKKDDEDFVDDQGKEALNFQITVMIIGVALFVLTCLTLGMAAPLVGILGLVDLIFCILAGVAAGEGKRYRYPWALRLIK